MTRSWAGALVRLAFVTTEADARDLLLLAQHRGADPETLRAAYDEWQALQSASVTTIESEAYAR